MPHLVLECSRGVADDAALENLIDELHRTLGAAPTVDIAAVKSRIVQLAVWRVGAAPDRRFLHLTVSLLDGRSLETRRQIGDALFASLKSWANQRVSEVSISMELRVMCPETYWK
jgi:5-carboxymethyl-2-hydroxymuconate isomerase